VLREDVESTYQRFLGRVAEGRGMSPEAVDAVARGRVWTGEQALEMGLVDRLGGIPDAVLVAKERAGLAPDADVMLVQYPPPKPLAQQLVEALQGGGAVLALPGWPARVRDLVATLAALPLGAPLLISPEWIEIH
jgi:protease-4